MTKADLLKRISHMSDDACIVLKGEDGGWSNLSGKVDYDGVTISIYEDRSRPFTSDN